MASREAPARTEPRPTAPLALRRPAHARPPAPSEPGLSASPRLQFYPQRENRGSWQGCETSHTILGTLGGCRRRPRRAGKPRLGRSLALPAPLALRRPADPPTRFPWLRPNRGFRRRLAHNVTPKVRAEALVRAVKPSHDHTIRGILNGSRHRPRRAGKPRLGRSLALPAPLALRRPADPPTRFSYPPTQKPFFRAVCRKRFRNFVSMNAKAAGRPSDW
jgi:hypothetical protein